MLCLFNPAFMSTLFLSFVNICFLCNCICVYVWACAYVGIHTCWCLRGPEEELELQAIVNFSIWALGTKLESSERRASALDCWATVPASMYFYLDAISGNRQGKLVCMDVGNHSSGRPWVFLAWKLAEQTEQNWGRSLESKLGIYYFSFYASWKHYFDTTY